MLLDKLYNEPGPTIYVISKTEEQDAVNFLWEKIRDKYAVSEYLVLIDDGQNSSCLFFGGSKKESENEINKKLGNMLFKNKGGFAVYDIKNDKETNCVTEKVIIK